MNILGLTPYSFEDQFRLNDQASNRTSSQLDASEELSCEPESDRISIDELSSLSPWNGRVEVWTGAGKDVLSIQAVIGSPGNGRNTYVLADLGADGNMSLGAALNIGIEKDSLVAGVVFDNRRGVENICFLLKDFRTIYVVGSVKKVTIFKGSR